MLMSGINHSAQVVRATIAVEGCEKIDTVVSPTYISGELSQRYIQERNSKVP